MLDPCKPSRQEDLHAIWHQVFRELDQTPLILLGQLGQAMYLSITPAQLSLPVRNHSFAQYC